MCVCVCVCVCAKSLQSCPTLCDPKGHSPPGSSVHGILHKSTGVGCHALLQGNLPNPGVEPSSPATPVLQAGSSLLSHRGSPTSWVLSAYCKTQGMTEGERLNVPLGKLAFPRLPFSFERGDSDGTSSPLWGHREGQVR